MNTTWHPALKHLSKILREKYDRHNEKDIYLKKVFPEKPTIVFCQKWGMRSIRNYIVWIDINEANDQKKPKIATPCFSCRKTCHLINRDETLKNIHNGKDINPNCHEGSDGGMGILTPHPSWPSCKLFLTTSIWITWSIWLSGSIWLSANLSFIGL